MPKILSTEILSADILSNKVFYIFFFFISPQVSVYPEESKKVLVVADIIEKFNFKYVYAVTDDNVEGDAAIATLKEKLGKMLILWQLLPV